VGSRSSTETVVAILKAFLDQRTWKQAELARQVAVSTAAAHKCLVELQKYGVPLTSDKDHPHVYWSVPKSWYPGGVLFTGEQVTQILRQLSRLPKSKARNQLVDVLLKYLPTRNAADAVVPAETTAREEQYLPLVEDAAEQKVALRFRYFSAKRGSESVRHASVHRVLLGPPARFVAVCHRSNTLKWFRVESMSDASLDLSERFRDADQKEVDAHLRASLDGFHEGGASAEHVFVVREPDARWVARNLIDEMRSEDVQGGIRVTVQTAGLQRLARYVVGLGAAAKPVTPELEAAVGELARGALAAIETKPLA
jgi:predicted DNA-binding transcriptional regulator YafY